VLPKLDVGEDEDEDEEEDEVLEPESWAKPESSEVAASAQAFGSFPQALGSTVILEQLHSEKISGLYLLPMLKKIF